MKSTFTFFVTILLAFSLTGQSHHQHDLNYLNADAQNNFKSPLVIKHRMDSTIYEDYYESKDEWYLDDKQDFIYDENGNMVESSWYYMENSQWLLSDLTEFTYDENGLIILKVENYVDESTSQLVVNYKTEYTYNGNQQLALMIETNWNTNTNQWELTYKKAYIYNDAWDISVINDYHWEEDTEEWINGDSAVYNYDYNNYIELVLVYEWDNDNSEWKENTKKEYTCDENGNVTSRIISYMNYNTNEWSTYSKREYEYDANANPTIEIAFYWDESKGEWYEEYKYEYSYNLDYDLNDMILPPRFYYNPDYFENISNMPIDYLKYSSNYGTTWYLSKRATYYYSEQNVTNVSYVSESSIKVFPNPVRDKFVINCTCSDIKITNINLYNVVGKKQEVVQNDNQMNIQHLAEGIYFLKIEFSNGSSEIIKIVKN